MLHKNVVVLKQAQEDINLGKQFYDSIEDGVGNYFVNCILSDLEALLFYGGIHKKIYGLHQALSKRSLLAYITKQVMMKKL